MKKAIAIILSLVLILAVTIPAAAISAPIKKVYPIKTKVTLRYWVELNSNLAATSPNLGYSPFGKALQQKTGVKIKFIHPAQNQTSESLNILLASGDLPDIIEYGWANQFPGGPSKALKDGYIMKLNDLIDKNAPNLKKYLTSNPDINTMVKTDDGSFYVFPFIRGDSFLQVFQGPMIRSDLLKKVDLPVPTTIDEWYKVLKAFKDKLNIPKPLTLMMLPDDSEKSSGGILGNSCFVGAYGIGRNFYLDPTGKVKYGPEQAAFKEFITTMQKWYSEGLLDKDFGTVDKKTQDANMTSGKSAATVGNAGGSMGNYLPPLKVKDPNNSIVGAPYPVLKKGDKPQFGQMDWQYANIGAAISSTCKNPDLAAQVLDFGYSPEGLMLYNFGIENTSYTMRNGYPTYTQSIMNNPALPMSQAMAKTLRASYNGPFIQDRRYQEQYSKYQEQKDAINIWTNTNAAKTKVPMITPSPDESAELAKILADCNTLVNETFFKMVLGAAPISDFDKYIDTLRRYKIDRAVEIEQAALDRFNKR